MCAGRGTFAGTHPGETLVRQVILDLFPLLFSEAGAVRKPRAGGRQLLADLLFLRSSGLFLSARKRDRLLGVRGSDLLGDLRLRIGRSGGGQINVVTRGGGEDFHGSAYEFVRNDILNANDFISNRSTNPPFGRESNGKAKRAPFRYNDYGFTLGGPVYFPNFGEGKSDAWFSRLARTYFFFSEEQRKDRRYPLLTAPAGVPDLQMRQGIFPIDICLSAFTAATSGTVPCTSVLPRGTPLSSAVAINPVAQQYLNFIYNKLPAPTDALTRGLIFPAQGIFDFRQ